MEPTSFLSVVHTSQAVAAVSARGQKIAYLAELLARVAPDEIETVVAFLSGSLRQGRIGLGWALLSEARDTPPALVPSLSVAGVDRALDDIARLRGPGTAAEKRRRLRDLFARAVPDEQAFLVRLVSGELRQGALEGVLAEAVARAARIDVASVHRATMAAGSLAPVARAVLTGGAAALGAFSLTVLQPIRPMLADAAEDVEEALARLGPVALEWKIDGARIQVHKAEEEVRIFSRHLRDVTPALPEVVEIVRALPARELVLDGEAIALDPHGAPLPFQTTMRRFGRRLEVARLREALPLTPFFFDCLLLDGTSLVDEPQRRRFDELVAIAGEHVVPHLIDPDPAAAAAFFDAALRRGHEGVVAKARGSAYAAGRRGAAWIKVKRARSLDLVVLAAEWGHGRRRGWLSNLHLGARDPFSNGFVMLGKTFKGLTDAMLAWQTERLLALEIARDDYAVYVRPELVVEIAFNDIQESPQYPGGLALRFARVKRFRPDKPAAEADTIDTVRRIHEKQA